ncbi:hypothetical protein [Streptomyces liliiviolaceus]|uniref:hypothetical protein n=1 Tax=Streptomyces liliiviolaceus TaxID=2823109 RepID=UPI001FFDA8D9|nr:hypothetical protein [Streptomyces liliiviolaceus]
MTHAFYSDAAEKIRSELTHSERAAVETVRISLENDPHQGRALPGPDPQSASHVVELLPEATDGRGISVAFRYSHDLDAAPHPLAHRRTVTPRYAAPPSPPERILAAG